MDNMNSFSFKIKVETNPLNISDVYEALDNYTFVKKKHDDFSAVVVPKTEMLAEKKLELIMAQCQPLFDIIVEFNGKGNNRIYQIYAEVKNPNNGAKFDIYLKQSRQGWFLSTNSYKEGPIQAFTSGNFKNGNLDYYVSHENPFTKWNEWNVFVKLKENLISQINGFSASLVKRDAEITNNYNRMIND